VNKNVCISEICNSVNNIVVVVEINAYINLLKFRQQKAADLPRLKSGLAKGHQTYCSCLLCRTTDIMIGYKIYTLCP